MCPRRCAGSSGHASFKDVRCRLRNIGDARLLLDSTASDQKPERPRPFAWLPWVLALASATVVAVLLFRGPRVSESPRLWLSGELGPEAVQGRDITAVLSPDGKRVVYPIRTAGGGQQLALRPLTPATSPDGKWIAYTSNEGGELNKLYVQRFTPAENGRSQRVVACSPSGPRSAQRLFYFVPPERRALTRTAICT